MTTSRPTRTAALVLAALITATSLAGDGLTADEPTIPPPKPGSVAVRITPGKCKSIRVVSRHTEKTYIPRGLCSKSGRCAFPGLPGDATYDVTIETFDGRNFEGIDLEFVDARLLRMAAARRKQLELPPEPARAFTKADADWMVKFVADMKDFMDTRRVLYIQGHGRRATMLVELLRTRDFHADKGDVIWRMELWYFEWHSGGWQRVPNQENVLRRFRGKAEDLAKIAIEYRPELSVFIDADGKSQPVTFEIPAASDPSRGRPTGAELKLKTAPHIFGIDKTTEADGNEAP
ncbi:MAG: hypothetical protein ACYS8X_08910 [Planctomycetota bacterium]|jgi:hypothetical protein